MTDQDDTQIPEDEPTRELPPTTEQAAPVGPKRLLRSKNDRVIGGVSGGLGRYFDVDPVIFRIAFAVSILFGGLGIFAYLAAWLFVPADDGTGVAAPPQRGAGFVRVVGMIALVIAGLFGFGVLIAGAAFVTGIGYGYLVAGVIVLIGVALIVTSFRGGARWLIVPALALSIGVGVAAAADLDLEGGDRQPRVPARIGRGDPRRRLRARRRPARGRPPRHRLEPGAGSRARCASRRGRAGDRRAQRRLRGRRTLTPAPASCGLPDSGPTGSTSS